MTCDEAIGLFAYLRCAHSSRVTLAEFMEGELYRARMCAKRAESSCERNPTEGQRKHLAWAQSRLVDIQKLIATYASMRGEHPEARMPVFKDKTRVCEPQIAELAARLQDGVERAVQVALDGEKEMGR
jgi:sirohydrochlorin ferrochelatase